MTRHRSLLVGCGARAQAHASALADSERFDLVAVCDLVEERARETATEFNVPSVYTDFEAAIDDEDPTHVSVITPPNARVPLVTNVLTLEPPSLLIEKPVANTFSDVRRIADAAGAVDTRVTVCHQKPWADEVSAVKEWSDEGRLGEITRCIATTKLGTASQGTHLVHTLNWLLGRYPTRVHGWAQGPESLDHDDEHAEPADALYELTYPNDARAFVHQGWESPDVPEQDPAPLEYKFDVVGTDGRAQFVLGDHASGIFRDGVERVEARAFDEDAYMTRGLYDRLGRVLDGTVDDHPSDLDSAIAAHRVLEAALRSAVESRGISPNENPPAIGAGTVDRLKQTLTARTPVTVSSLLYGDRPREDVLRSLANLGVHSVDLWGTKPFVDHHFDPESESAESVREELERYAMGVPVVSVYDDEPVVEKLRFAADIGSETAVMGGRTPDRPETWEPARLEKWLDIADELGLTLAFENHLDTLETIDEMQSVLDTLDHPAAGICLAPSHLRIVGEDPVDAVVELGNAIDVCYLWDMEPDVARTEADAIWWDRPDSQVPGGGGVDFESYLDAIVRHCPNAHWVLCYHGTEEWDSDRIDESIARSLRFLETRRPGLQL